MASVELFGLVNPDLNGGPAGAREEEDETELFSPERYAEMRRLGIISVVDNDRPSEQVATLEVPVAATR